MSDWRISAASVGVLVLCGVFVYTMLQSSRFEKEFAAYDALATAHEAAAYLPGSSNNPVRQDLNRLLSEVLVQGLSAHDRLALADQGLEQLANLEKQIDAIGEAGEKVDAAVARMQVDSVGTVSSSIATHELLTLAKKRSAIIADIRGLSYRANFETKKIFDRVIADKGALTKEHVLDLNEQIPIVEEQFNRRSDLYAELQSISQEIREKTTGANEGFSITLSPLKGQVAK